MIKTQLCSTINKIHKIVQNIRICFRKTRDNYNNNKKQALSLTYVLTFVPSFLWVELDVHIMLMLHVVPQKEET